MPRKILHFDLDAFFCSVEELRHPELAGKPFAVGGRPGERGVISSCSYGARSFGVRSAMPSGQALRLCPELIILPGDHRLYSEASRQVMEHLQNWTALVEQISIDEAFLDLSDLPEPGEVLARRLQTEIRQVCHLPCSLGVASNKLVAKIATDVGKAAAIQTRKNRLDAVPSNIPSSPCAITVVVPGEEAQFLAPLPVKALWGVGPKTAERFAEMSIYTIGDLAGLSQAELTQRFGKNGAELYWRSRGVDDRPIETVYQEKSISQEVTFARDVSDRHQLEETMRQQSESVAFRLREANLTGRTVRLKLRWPDFTTLSRQTTLAQPSDLGSEISAAVHKLFEKAWAPGKPVRLLGVGVSRLEKASQQLELWETEREKDHRLQQTLDGLREKFGKDAVQRGRVKKE